MPRDGAGTYTLPAGNPVAPLTLIESTWANPTMSDIANQLNNVLTRDGLLGPTGQLKIISGTVSAPGLAFSAEASTGIYRNTTGQLNFTVLGVAQGQFNANGFEVNGTTFGLINIASGAAANIGAIRFSNLSTSLANRRWDLVKDNAAESGSNAGSNFQLQRYDDTGTLLGSSIIVARSTGITTISGLIANTLTCSPATAGGFSLVITSTTTAQIAQILLRNNNVQRWNFGKLNNAESGSNAGSDFFMDCYADDGSTFLVRALSITRANGVATFGSTIQTVGAAATIGYAAGSGGTVTQTTNKSTAVTLNKGSGQITMNNAALGAGAAAAFSLNNSLIADGDVVVVQHANTGTLGGYTCIIAVTGAGFTSIRVTNITAGSLSEAIVLSFVVIKGAKT